MSAARRQRGAALLVLLTVIVVGGLWYLLAAMTPNNRVSTEREVNARLLRDAKDALLGWVAANAADTTDINPGRLPCPEALGNFTNPPAAGEGVMAGFCAGAATAVGRLPWRSLGLDKPYDASGEVLWLVVAPGWKLPNNTNPALGLNSNSSGALSVDGAANVAVAAIIAPGPKMQLSPTAAQTAQGCSTRTQNRLTFPPTDSLDYIECQNIAGAALRTGITGNAYNPAFNDQVVIITAAEVLAAIEPVIARRIESTVAPQLAAMYASATWGTSATDMVFPYPAPFGNPATSDYKGSSAATEGLLPLTAYTSNALTSGRNDANFILWNTATVTATQTGGTATSFSSNCTTSTTTTVTCNVTFSRTCVLCFNNTTANVQVQAKATNVGMTMRTLNTAAATGLGGTTSFTAPLQTDSTALATYTGTLTGSGLLCGTFISLLCSGSGTVTIPITAFADHPLANPATTDQWYWFIANNWHQVTYYAVSPSHLASSATHNCSTATNCITIKVAGNSDSANRKAILILAGRSINGTTRPNATLANYLEGGNTSTLDRTFAQDRYGKTFNDRVVTVSNY